MVSAALSIIEYLWEDPIHAAHARTLTHTSELEEYCKEEQGNFPKARIERPPGYGKRFGAVKDLPKEALLRGNREGSQQLYASCLM